MPIIVLYASLVSFLAAPPPFPAAPKPALKGSWVLNAAQSDDARALLEARQRAMTRARPGMDRPGMGGGGDGMGGGMGGAAPAGGTSVYRERARNVVQSVIDAPAAFTITQDDTSLVLAYGKGRRTVLITDGEKLTDNVDGIGYVDTMAEWERHHLVVDHRFEVGGRLVEDFSLSPDASQLLVAVEFDSPRTGKVRFRRVYDRSAAPPGD